jgi:acylglycerol kinase
MRTYCQEASAFGDEKIRVSEPLKKVLVILNPAADKKSSEENFEKYCAPILHLAGFNVTIVKTESEGHAIRYIEELDELPDSVVVAGGDGTLAETVTGLLRRSPETIQKIKVGVFPLGHQNTTSVRLYSPLEPPKNKVEEARTMALAALSVVKGKVAKKDVVKIELLETEEGQEPRKPFYALSSFQWGAYRDITAKRDKYWYTNGLRTYMAFLFNGFHRGGVTWDCEASLTYTDPCQGCKNCWDKQETRMQKIHQTRWWSKFIPRFGVSRKDEGPDYSKITNENCAVTKDLDVRASELIFTTNNFENPESQESKLHLKIGPADYYGFSFIGESWKRVWTKNHYDMPDYKIIEARTVQVIPNESEKDEKREEKFFNIDNEAYEVMPVKISLIPRRIDFYVM